MHPTAIGHGAVVPSQPTEVDSRLSAMSPSAEAPRVINSRSSSAQTKLRNTCFMEVCSRGAGHGGGVTARAVCRRGFR